MPKVLPMRAVRYALRGAGGGDLSTRIAPPYDVLDEGPKRRLLDRDAHNIVAIDLPVTPPKTVGPDEAYGRAGSTYRAWLAEGVLRRDAESGLYAYEQAYELGGRGVRRRGVFVNLAVEQFNRPGGGIFRHEHTIKGGRDDRLKLMEATAAQLSPIFAVFDDTPGVVGAALGAAAEREPDFRGTTDDGVEHRCWRIGEAATIERIAAALEATDVFIADGHHRYTTALNYHAAHADQPLSAGCLFVLVPVQDAGLQVLPTHRVLCEMAGFEFGKLEALLGGDARFELRRTEHGADGLARLGAELAGLGHHAVGLYDAAAAGGAATWVLSTREADPLAATHGDRPAVWRTLDVAVLHELLVDRVLRPAFGGEAITYKYPHDFADFATMCHAEGGRLGVVMQATPLEAVCDVARAGAVMPPKSTFFYPKLATGLVINPLT